MKVGSIINVPSYISLNNTYLSFRGKSHKIDDKKYSTQIKHVRWETIRSNGFPENFGSSIPAGTLSDSFR